MARLSRRSTVRLLASAALAPAVLRTARADEKVLTIGMTFPVTGTLALQAGQVRDAALFAIAEVNEKGGIAGYKLRDLTFDDASPTTGQYDPALAATNARKLLQDPSVIAAIGPLNSGSAKAVSPIYSQGGIATISGSATNPDLTSPKFAAIYRPAGRRYSSARSQRTPIRALISRTTSLRRSKSRRSSCWTTVAHMVSAWRMHSRRRRQRRE